MEHDQLLISDLGSQRLEFRMVRPNDFEAWLPFYHDPTSTQYWTGLPKDPKEACVQQFERIFERYEKGLGGMNALILKNTDILVGLCGLLVQTVDAIEELEIGYSILPEYRCMGYAYEAANHCKQYAKRYDLAKSLISIIHVDNVPSQRVALKNGMTLSSTTTYKNNPVHIFRLAL